MEDLREMEKLRGELRRNNPDPKNFRAKDIVGGIVVGILAGIMTAGMALTMGEDIDFCIVGGILVGLCFFLMGLCAFHAFRSTNF